MNEYTTEAMAREHITQLTREGNRLWQEGQIEEAAEKFLLVKSLDANSPSLLKFTAFVAMQKGQYAVAAGHYKKLIDQSGGNAELWFNQAMAFYHDDRFGDALAALDNCLNIQPQNLAARLYKGIVFERLNHKQGALDSYIKALRLAEKMNTKSLPDALQNVLAHAATTVKIALDITIEKYLSPLYEKYGKSELARIRRCADFFVGKTPIEFSHPKWRPALFYIPGLSPSPFFDRLDFPQLRKMEDATDIIREELLAVMAKDEGFHAYINHPEGSSKAATWKELNQSKKWSTYHFFRHGKHIDENCARCPKTTAILESMDLMRIPGYGPEAMFSILAPHTKIKAHYGSINGRLIVHLPLVIPKDCGAIRVADQQKPWHLGECIVFDDSFEHEAWNDSDEARAVLIFDIWNPQLSVAERAGYIALHRAAQDFELGLSS